MILPFQGVLYSRLSQNIEILISLARLIIGILIRYGGAFMKLDANIISLFQPGLYPLDILTWAIYQRSFC